jgi:hypothetical protein
MAKFISSIGQITGKLGGVVFKTRGNKTYISKAPGNLKPTRDPATKLRRKKFGWVGRFASTVNSFPILKALWNSQSPGSRSSFNKIFKQVFSTFPSSDYSGPIVFTPPNGFKLAASSVVFGKSSVFIEVSTIPSGPDIKPGIEQSVLAAGIMVLSSPVKEGCPEETFLPVQSGKISLSLNVPPAFIIPLTGSGLCMYECYRAKKAYLTLITLDASGSPVRHSVIIS